MRILLTNDDGIHALGLCALYEALRDDHELFVVAPDAERSAVGHAITLVDPLRVREVKRRGRRFGWAVNGTPADCVKLAVRELVGPGIDLVLSGINLGANVGINILYSGTVSAATEAAILGIRAAAVSLDTLKDPDFCFAAGFTASILEWIKDLPLQRGVALNINIPARPPKEIRGARIAKQELRPYEETFEKRVDPRGNVYYWQSIQERAEVPESDVDAELLRRGFITITPIHYDLTAHDHLERIVPPAIS